MVKVLPWAVRASRSSRELKPRPHMPVNSTEIMVHYSNLLFTSRTTTLHSHAARLYIEIIVMLHGFHAVESAVARPRKGREPEAPVTPDKPRAMRLSMRMKHKIKNRKGIHRRPIPMVISWACRAARSDCDRRPMKQSEGDSASTFEKTLEKSEIEVNKALPTEEHQSIKELEAPVTYDWVSVGASVYEDTSKSTTGFNESRSVEEQHASKQTETHATLQAQVHVEESPKKPNMTCEPQLAKEHASVTHQARHELFHEGTTNQVFKEMLEKCNTEFNKLQVAYKHEGEHMYNNFDSFSKNGVYNSDHFVGIHITSRVQRDTFHEGDTTSTIEEPGQKNNIDLSRLHPIDEHQVIEEPNTRDYCKSSQHAEYKSNAEEDKPEKQKKKITVQKIKKKKKIRPKIKDFTNGSQTLRQLKQNDNKGPKRRYIHKNEGWNPNSEDNVEFDASNTSWKAVDRRSPPAKRNLHLDLEGRPLGVAIKSSSTRPYTESTLDQKKLVEKDSNVRHSPSRRETIQRMRQKFRVHAFLRRLNLSLGGEAMDLITKGDFTRPYTKLTLKPNKLAAKYSVGSRPSRRECLKKRSSMLAVLNQIYQDLVNSSCRSYVTSNPSCVTLYKDFHGQFCGTLYKNFYGQFMKVDKNGRRKRKMIESLQECWSYELPTCDDQSSQAIVPYIKPVYDNMKYQKVIISFVRGDMLVPFKKLRVKVDLDLETKRVWNFLMGKEDR